MNICLKYKKNINKMYLFQLKSLTQHVQLKKKIIIVSSQEMLYFILKKKTSKF